MKFRKGSFFIQNIPNAKSQFELRSGWLSENGEFGFCKFNSKVWRVTDVASGMYIYTSTTRKDCADFIENNTNLINAARAQQKCIDAVEAMRNFIETELRKENSNA